MTKSQIPMKSQLSMSNEERGSRTLEIGISLAYYSAKFSINKTILARGVPPGRRRTRRSRRACPERSRRDLVGTSANYGFLNNSPMRSARSFDSSEYAFAQEVSPPTNLSRPRSGPYSPKRGCGGSQPMRLRFIFPKPNPQTKFYGPRLRNNPISLVAANSPDRISYQDLVIRDFKPYHCASSNGLFSAFIFGFGNIIVIAFTNPASPAPPTRTFNGDPFTNIICDG
jgi:hypothetical protein